MAISTIDNNGANLGQLGNRNMVTNGSMQVAQRSTSVTGIGADQTAYHTIDRWQIETGGSNSGRFTMSQSSDAPSGFGSSLKLDCTTSDTSIGAGEYLLLEYKIEGQDVQRIKKGTPDAEEITISFYVKANAAFNFVLEVLDSTNSRRCSKLFSTTTGWNRVELTYPADTTGAIANNNAEGIRLFFWIHAGSDYTSGTLNSSSFTTNPPAANIASGISSFYSSTSNEFYLTGFQMEVGDTATPFEHRSYGDELAKCQRYFYLKGSGTGFGSAQSGSGAYARMYALPERHPVEMRATPTVSLISGGSTYFAGGGGVTVGTPTGDIGTIQNSVHTLYSVNSSTTGVNRLSIGDGFSFTRGMSYVVTSNFIQVDAEL
jgi:hypothetical protein